MEEMRETLKKLKDKGSKIGINDIDKAAQIIYDIYLQNNDKRELIESLINFNYKIMGAFVAKYLIKMDNQDEIFNLIFSNKKYKDKITFFTLSIFRRCLSGINTEVVGVKVLLNMCTEITLNSKFNKVFIDNMYKIMTESSYRLFSCNFSNLSLGENKKIYRCFEECLKEKKDERLTEMINLWNEKYLLGDNVTNNQDIITEKKEDKKQGDKLNEVIHDTPKETYKNINENLIAFEKLNKLIVDSNNEIDKLFNKIFIKNQTLLKLEEELSIKKNELEQKIEENKLNYKRVLELENAMKKLNDVLELKENENADLRDRLKLSFSADEINKNQEIVTLKNNISKSIRLQYDDFLENGSAECTEDNYEALKVIITQVFRALKKYGIEL